MISVKRKQPDMILRALCGKEGLQPFELGFGAVGAEKLILIACVKTDTARRDQCGYFRFQKCICTVFPCPVGEAVILDGIDERTGSIGGLDARIGCGGHRRKETAVGKSRHTDTFGIAVRLCDKIIDAAHDGKHLERSDR